MMATKTALVFLLLLGLVFFPTPSLAGCRGGGIKLNNQKVKIDASTGDLSLSASVIFDSTSISPEVTAEVSYFGYTERVDVDLCDGTSGTCPDDCVVSYCSVELELGQRLPDEAMKWISAMSLVRVSADIYQEGEKITSCSFGVYSASLWNGASTFLTVGAVVVALGAGWLVRQRRRKVALLNVDGTGENGAVASGSSPSASFVEMKDAMNTATSTRKAGVMA